METDRKAIDDMQKILTKIRSDSLHISRIPEDTKDALRQNIKERKYAKFLQHCRDRDLVDTSPHGALSAKR